MFPKGKAATVPSDTQAKEKLANYVYEYLIHIGAAKAAQTFLQEIHWENKPWNLGESPGFLSQWWCVFYDLYSAAPERRETFEHSSEAKAFHDYGFVNSGYHNGIPRNPSISPMSGGLPPGGGRPPSSQGIMPPDSGMHTPASIQGGPMMVPSGHFFPPGHPMSNATALDLIRTRGVLPPNMRFPQTGPPMMPNYGGPMPPRHRFIGGGQGQVGPPGSGGAPSVASMVHSPVPGNAGPPGPGGDPSGAMMDGQVSGGSPSHASGPGSQSSANQPPPAPAFPPPPVSESTQNNTGSNANSGGPTPTTDSQNQNQPLVNGNGASNNGPNSNTTNPQFPPPHSHTMEYLPPHQHQFDPNGPNSNSNNPGGMKPHHSPAPDAPSLMPHDFGGPHSFQPTDHPSGGGPGGHPHHPHHPRGGGPGGVMTPISQIQMMQQQAPPNLGPPPSSVPMSSSVVTSAAGPPFISSNQQPISGGPGIPISAGSNQFPDYAFTSMSQAI